MEGSASIEERKAAFNTVVDAIGKLDEQSQVRVILTVLEFLKLQLRRVDYS